MVRAKFTPIGDELSPEVAFVQAAMALDVAGTIAQKREDVKGMAEVAALYIELADRMMGGSSSEVDEEALAKKAGYFGFTPAPAVVEPETEEHEDERIDE